MSAQVDIAVVGSEVGDVENLYRRLASRLEQIVRLDVRAPDAVIEDACQFAWCRLVDHRERVHREAALSWLATTAVREAFKLSRRGARDRSLEAIADSIGDVLAAPVSPGPDARAETLERLETIATLPARQQRLMWLQGLGLSYAEMAIHEGCTTRTVERQLLRAKSAIRRTCASGTE